MTRVFKIFPAALWAEAQTLGHLPWSKKDQEDGFVHLSALHQVKETAARHFDGQRDLVVLELDPAKLTDLRWEPSRGGALFPHVYADILLDAVLGARALVGAVPGVFDWPTDIE